MVRKLLVEDVFNLRTASDEPVPKPLVWYVRPHPIVRRRGHDPSYARTRPYTSHSAIGALDVTRNRRERVIEIVLGLSANQLDQIDVRWSHALGGPKLHRIARLRRVGPGHLIREVTRQPLRPRSV